MYYTSKQISFGILDDKNYVISSGSKQELTSDIKFFDNLVNLCDFCLDGKEEIDVINFMKVNKIDEYCFQYLINNRYILPKKIDFSDRYSRNHLYYETIGYDSDLVQKAISKSHILCVGVGGIGNIISYLAASIGFQKITLIDDDTIEKTNLNRQFLFRECDIGCKKVDIIKRELNNINKNLIVNIISQKISKEILESIENIDIIISSADDDYCLSLMNEYCCHKKIPMVGVGYINDISTIGPFYIPDLTSCLYCNKDIYLEKSNYNEKIVRINNAYKAPSTIVNNFFAGAMISSEIIKFFAKDYASMLSINNIIGIHNKTFLLEKIKIEKSPNCIYCGVDRHV